MGEAEEALRPSGPELSKESPRSPFRRRDFSLFWLAGAVDGLGTCASSLFLPLILLGAGYSAGLAGLVGSTALISGLVVSPVAGVFADRRPRKPMMYAAALTAAAAMGSVFVAVALGRVVLVHVLLAAVVEQAASATYGAAASGTIRRLVPPGEYPRAIGLLQARDQAVQIVGPSLGGVLYQLARWVPLLADAVSFLLVAAATKAIRTDLTPEREGPAGSFTRDLSEGLRFVWAEPFLRFVVVWTAGINALLGTLYFHAVFTSHDQGASPSSIGLILTLAGVGGLLGALAAPWLVRRIPAARIVTGASWAMVPTAAGLAFASRTWTYGLLLSGVSLIVPSVVVVLQTRAILVTPDRLLARMGTVLGTAGQAVAVLAPVAAGVLVASYGGRPVAWGCAGAFAALALYATVRAGLVVKEAP
ncbi:MULTISPECIES: MFS transporter [unclassified Streptomyces]|uniref:MFS transporter n=1 Tax=unclassified Streptomyces TaxID=2593676 RepID=UPI0016611CDE|nr:MULTISPECIES: MFS transporter [unclassified Streptomyces]MBD0706976.1 MFS transporter [Streptomyces sp. CBMA291]MBD0710337.1 MFS transporter [Streptomyces sp. CBMA291]MBD0717294.1 MFS transporter [Streptomyces sp. CBMA370]